MTKNFLFATAAALTMAGCSPQTDNKRDMAEENTKNITVDSATLAHKRAKVDEILEMRNSVNISVEDYNKMINFINKNGIILPNGDKQFTFIDSKGGRHAMILVMKENNTGVYQISVRGYKNGKKNDDPNNAVCYGIHETKATIATSIKSSDDMPFMERGVKEFIDRVQ